MPKNRKPPVLLSKEVEEEDESPVIEDDRSPDEIQAEAEFVADVLVKLDDMYRLKQEPQPVLGGQTFKERQDADILDYGALSDELQDPDDPVKKYTSTVSRDKTFAVIANATSDLLYPDVTAQNDEQMIDRVLGRVSSSLLRFAHKHDGFPNEMGEQKNSRYAHTAAIEGTCHVLDIVTKDGLESELVPNEEVFIPNFFQPNLQKQPRFYRAKFNTLYEEAEAMFGHRKEFRRVGRDGNWWDKYQDQSPDVKNSFGALLEEDKVSIIYIWEHKITYTKKGSPKRKVLQNVLVNDVPMFPPDHKLPYHHGYYPLSKLIFEYHAKADYYWGNSVPSKCREDKTYKEELKTLLRFKGKQAALPPQIIVGMEADDTMFLPSAITSKPQGSTVEAVPGITGVTQGDTELMRMTDEEISRATVSPKITGLPAQHRETASAVRIEASNSQALLDPFKKQIAYFMQSRSFPILMALFQMLPKRDLRRIAVPDEKLSDGLTGTFEIIFEDVDLLEAEQRMERSFKIRGEQERSRMRGEPKDTVYVSPSYVKNLKFYLFSDASGASGKDAMRRDRWERMLPFLLNNPDLFERKEIGRETARLNDFNEKILSKGQPAQAPMEGLDKGLQPTQPPPQGLPVMA